MQEFNSVVSGIFNLIILPFKTIDPIWSLALFSLLLGVLMLLIFRYTSDQQKIREVKSKIRAYIFELSLFKDDIGIVLSAQKNIFIHNLRYIKYALRPMLFMIIPVAIILIQLESWYGHRPLRPDEAAVVSLKLRYGVEPIPDITLTTGKGIDIETPPLRIPGEREVDWRIRAQEPGAHELKFKMPGQDVVQKVIVSGGGLTQISPLVSASDTRDMLLNPSLKPLPEGSIVERIRIDYPANSVEVYKWHVHWLVVVFVLSIVFGFALKGLFRVEI
jgi:hypothetical protein